MLIDHQNFSFTPSAGSYSGNTSHIRGLINQILVKPTQETTIYDINILNPSGIKIYERLSETGTLSEITEMPCNGIYTVSINNATVNEPFIVQVVTQE